MAAYGGNYKLQPSADDIINELFRGNRKLIQRRAELRSTVERLKLKLERQKFLIEEYRKNQVIGVFLIPFIHFMKKDFMKMFGHMHRDSVLKIYESAAFVHDFAHEVIMKQD